MHHLNNLHIYQLARKNVVDLNEIIENTVNIGDLHNQMQRAAISVVSNIAEGSNREPERSAGTQVKGTPKKRPVTNPSEAQGRPIKGTPKTSGPVGSSSERPLAPREGAPTWRNFAQQNTNDKAKLGVLGGIAP